MEKVNGNVELIERQQQTYVFQNGDRPEAVGNKRGNPLLWQLLPSMCACLALLPFGIMLGWPSPTYPVLLAADSPLPITMVQSPMVAGFLMFGNTVSTPLSHSYRIGTKHGVLLGLVFSAVGWTAMWLAANVYHLLVSRFVVGLGNGFIVGQVKIYVREMCPAEYASKSITLFMFLGILIAYCMGPLTDFRSFSLATIFATVAIFVVVFALPHSPRQHFRYGDLLAARRMLRKLEPNADFDDKVLEYEKVDEVPGLLAVVTRRDLQRRLWTLIVLTFIQQFAGVPSTIVYCEFMFRMMDVPYPQYCSIVYGATLLLCSAVGSHVVSRLNKRRAMMASSLISAVFITSNILVLRFEIHKTHCGYLPFVLMLAYVASYALGMGTVPFTMPDHMFPKATRPKIAHVHFSFFSLFAVAITKLFQVFYSTYFYYSMFCLFASMLFFGFFFVALLIPAEPIEDA